MKGSVFIFSRIQYNAPVIITFSILSLIVLMINYATEGLSNYLLFSVYKTSFTDPLAYIRIFTHVLGHIDIEHYFNNFVLLLVVGPMLEEKYGSKNLLIMIITTAFITGMLYLLISNKALLGASGIVFMLILLSSFVNLQKGKIPVTLVLVIIIFIGREIWSSITIEDNISRVTHIVGGVCGAVLGVYMNRNQLLINNK